MKLERTVSQTLKQKLLIQQRYVLGILAMRDNQLEREIHQIIENNPLLDIDEYSYNGIRRIHMNNEYKVPNILFTIHKVKDLTL